MSSTITALALLVVLAAWRGPQCPASRLAGKYRQSLHCALLAMVAFVAGFSALNRATARHAELVLRLETLKPV